MTAAEFGQSHRQFAVAAQAVAEDQDVSRAVHRLQRQGFLLPALGDEHVLAKVFPVAGRFPQAAVEQLRALDFEVPGTVEPHAQVFSTTRNSVQPFGCQNTLPTASSPI